MLGLVLAIMISGVTVVDSYGDDNHDRRENHGNGRYEERGRGHDRDYRDRRMQRRRVYRNGYYYEERVYVAPPVYYEPPPPPGIGIFLPSIIIRP
jgi:hypothetical protein